MKCGKDKAKEKKPVFNGFWRCDQQIVWRAREDSNLRSLALACPIFTSLCLYSPAGKYEGEACPLSCTIQVHPHQLVSKLVSSAATLRRGISGITDAIAMVQEKRSIQCGNDAAGVDEKACHYGYGEECASLALLPGCLE
jgi:hypothetical protein